MVEIFKKSDIIHRILNIKKSCIVNVVIGRLTLLKIFLQNLQNT